MKRKENQRLVETNDFVGGIHDSILDNNLSLADAYNDACVWIAELVLELRRAERGVSAGYTRTDTTSFKWRPKTIAPPVDDADAWIKG